MAALGRWHSARIIGREMWPTPRRQSGGRGGGGARRRRVEAERRNLRRQLVVVGRIEGWRQNRRLVDRLKQRLIATLVEKQANRKKLFLGKKSRQLNFILLQIFVQVNKLFDYKTSFLMSQQFYREPSYFEPHGASKSRVALVAHRRRDSQQGGRRHAFARVFGSRGRAASKAARRSPRGASEKRRLDAAISPRFLQLARRPLALALTDFAA